METGLIICLALFMLGIGLIVGTYDRQISRWVRRRLYGSRDTNTIVNCHFEGGSDFGVQIEDASGWDVKLGDQTDTQ